MLCLTRGALNGSVLANMSCLIFDGNNFPTDLKSKLLASPDYSFVEDGNISADKAPPQKYSTSVVLV